MTARVKLPTTVSTKGQVILPKEIRDLRRWPPGTKLLVENTPEGVLLTSAPLFPPTRPEDVSGMLNYRGPPLTVKDMEAAVAAEARRRARD